LIGNAIKFTDHGSVSVKVSAKDEVKPGTVIYRFEVQDTGRGIPEKLLSTIFEPFSKAHNYNKEEGSGLGLSIVKKFAETLGGHVGVITRLGQGSTFWTELPLRVAAPDVASQLQLLSLESSKAPLPVFAVGVQEKTFEVLREYLNYWNVPFEVVTSPARLAAFSHAIIEEGHLTCPQAEAYFDSVVKTRQRAIFLSSFPTYLSVKALKESKGVQDSVVIVFSPLTPIKISKAFGIVLDRPQAAAPDRTDSSFLHPGLAEVADSAPTAARPPSSISPKGVPAQTDHLDVMLVEDNPVTQLVFKKQFEKLRISFAISGSAEDCISTWKRYPGGVSLILMDVELDGPMTGLEATEAIRGFERELPGRPRTFIAIMTGRSLEEDRREAFSCGCDEFFIKPLSLVQTRDLIYRFVQTPS